MDRNRIEAAERDIIAELATSVEGYKNLTVLCLTSSGAGSEAPKKDRRAVDYMLQKVQSTVSKTSTKRSSCITRVDPWTRHSPISHSLDPGIQVHFPSL